MLWEKEPLNGEFELKRFSMCLTEIDLATKNNNYPARLMPKLERRKSECVQLMARAQRNQKL